MDVRKIILAVAALLLVLSAGAGNREGRADNPDMPFRYEVRFGYGGFPAVDYNAFGGGVDYLYETIHPCGGVLSSVYRDYNGPAYMTGIFSAEFDFIFKKWFTLSLGTGFNGYWCARYDGVTGDRTFMDRGLYFTFLPQARFTYFTREYFKLYSSIGLGFTVYGFNDRSGSALPAVQVVPIGMTAGRKVFGFFELGIGTLFMGCNLGVGVRF